MPPTPPTPTPRTFDYRRYSGELTHWMVVTSHLALFGITPDELPPAPVPIPPQHEGVL